VANLEVRAGGRSANVVPGTSGGTGGTGGTLTLEGTNCKPRTTASCTGNLNNALKVLRHRKNMNTRHLWSATDLRNGDETVVWELLKDIEQEYSQNRAFGHKKTSTLTGQRGKKLGKKFGKKFGKKLGKRKKKKGNKGGNSSSSSSSNSNLSNSSRTVQGTPVPQGPQNTGSTLTGRKRPTSLSANMSSRRTQRGLTPHTTQRMTQRMTQRKPFGLLDPESMGNDVHGEEHDPYATADDRYMGSSTGASIHKRRRSKKLTTTER
tara:strand:+ start:287 stop:1078 length:792 start_codon:yes stop_codon:yes gene_type:complete